jgi:hypothetical protein
MAHNLDRFTGDLEDVKAEAARLHIQPSTLRMYLEWYGEAMVVARTRHGERPMPAYEAEIRRQIHGERIKSYRQMQLPFPGSDDAYNHELRGW